MNAPAENMAVSPRPQGATAVNQASVFKMLLRREFWEHKGGFFWAPVVTGIIVTALTMLGTITGSILIQKAKHRQEIDWFGVELNGKQGLEAAREAVGYGGDVSLLMGIGIAFAVFVFVAFFYSLGSLYDERKDRSVLFWKSLPISDTQVVLSKAMWALVLAPVIAAGIGVIIGLALWLSAAASLFANGIPVASAIFTESHPFRVLLHVLSTIPVYVFWALPTVGWLMLCSAWARSKPFLWAVLVPVLTATVISWLGTLPGIEMPHLTIWYVMVFRGLFSIVPGTWYLNGSVGHPTQINDPEDLARAIDLTSSWQAFTTVDLWVGAVIGAAMIYGAIRLRRWRDDG